MSVLPVTQWRCLAARGGTRALAQFVDEPRDDLLRTAMTAVGAFGGRAVDPIRAAVGVGRALVAKVLLPGV